MRVADAIKRLREQRDWTQNDLAIKSGLAKITIEKYEAGERVPNLDSYEKLSAAYNLSPGGILENCGA